MGIKDWDAIAARLPGRNARQCRERWTDYLSPNVRNSPWTSEEEALLTAKYAELGPTWTRISRCFHERTDINVRSHWQKMQRRKQKSGPSPGNAPECEGAATAFDGICATLMKKDDFIARAFETTW
jgi:hypothetical protein